MEAGRQTGATAVVKVTGLARVRMEKSCWVVLGSYSGSWVMAATSIRYTRPSSMSCSPSSTLREEGREKPAVQWAAVRT